MRKLLPLILLISIFIQDAAGQPQQEWVQKYHSSVSQDDFLVDMVIDKEGNIYATGWIWITPSNSELDIVSMKYSNQSVLQWVRKFDGIAGLYDEPVGIAVDDSGYVYVGGSTQDSLFQSSFLLINY